MKLPHWCAALTVAAVLAGGSFAWSWPAEPSDLESQLTAARELASKEGYPQAIAAYSEIIRQWPDDPRAYTNRGVCLAQIDEKDKALADYTRSLELCAFRPEQLRVRVITLTNRADLRWHEDEDDRALVDTDAAIALNPEYPPSHVVRAKILYDLGDLEGAVASMQKAQSIDPQIKSQEFTPEGAAANLEKYSKNAQALAARGRVGLAKAVSASEIVFRKNPYLEPAIELLDKSLELDGSYAEAWCLRGEVEDLKNGAGYGEPVPEAIAFYDKAIDADAGWARAYLLRGLNNLRGIVELMGHYAEDHQQRQARAIADLSKAIELGTADVRAYTERADDERRHDASAQAVKDYTRALELGGNAEEIYFDRADAYSNLKDWTHAVEDLTAFIDLKPAGYKFARRADAYVELKDWDKARADYDRAIAGDPDDLDAYLGRARMHRLKGENSLAAADYAKAHELDGTVPEVSADLADAEAAEKERYSTTRALAKVVESGARLQEKMQEIDKSQKKLQKLQKRTQRMLMGDTRTPEDIIAEVTEFAAQDIADDTDYLDRALVYITQEKYDEAIEDCESAMHVNKENPKAWEYRGACYEEKDELLQARIDYSEAIKLDAGRATLWIDRGRVLRKSEEVAGAMSDFNKALNLDPKSVRALTERARLYFLTDRNDEAIADCDAALAIDPADKIAAKIKELALKDKNGMP